MIAKLGRVSGTVGYRAGARSPGTVFGAATREIPAQGASFELCCNLDSGWSLRRPFST